MPSRCSRQTPEPFTAAYRHSLLIPADSVIYNPDALHLWGILMIPRAISLWVYWLEAGDLLSDSKTLLLLKPRGFCAGVVRAIDIVRIALEAFGAPIYVRKEIVHNRYVVEELKAKGAIFVDEVYEVPDGQRLIYSAHGVSPSVREASKLRNLRVIDATCPLVTKVHVEAVKYARGG